jgi:outer membrane protein OmpA-like peptidoglycan-associated protein
VRLCRAWFLVGLIVTASCAHQQSSSQSTAVQASPSTEASVEATSSSATEEAASPAASEALASPAPTEAALVSAAPEYSAQATPVPVPTATENSNLLDTANGTILRNYSPPQLDGMSDGNLSNASQGIGVELPDSAHPPFVFTFELPSTATISEFDATMGVPSDEKSPAHTLAIAVSTSSATDGFRDVGTISQLRDGSSAHRTLKAGVSARWVRLTASDLFGSVEALGSMSPPTKKFDPTGVFIEQAYPNQNGGFVPQGRKTSDYRARFVQVGNDLTATECVANGTGTTYVGSLSGREWNAVNAGDGGNPSTFRGSYDDEGQILAGRSEYGDGGADAFSRAVDTPVFCAPRKSGIGVHQVLVLDQHNTNVYYPVEASPPFPGFTFSEITAGMLDASMLQTQPEAVLIRGACQLTQLEGPAQRKLLLDYVAAGHKLIIASAGCNAGADYSWLPYPFTMNGSGPETSNGSLMQLEQSALGTDDKADAAHFADVPTYLAHGNAADAALPVSTVDSHWCGHFFVAKTSNLNGFVTMYAPYGKGLMIYDGFSASDLGNLNAHRFHELELELPVDAALPCTQHVSDHFFLSPNGELNFQAGKAQTLRATMEVYANLAYSGHVTLTATGGLPATVSPSSFDIAGGVQALTVNVNVPASAKPGAYSISVSGDTGNGRKSTATLLVTGTGAPIRKATVALHQRIRIYGIHFDYDSATIQPSSEPVIADIAALMKANPTWHFEVSGHTDSDGGASYNLGLSQRRAQSVVADLAKRYGIAQGRLVAKGYGLTRPVASNDTPAGKALNRRVELERLR